ncbi:MAG: FlgD immunoglobulin-like domain containing protein [Candidatus Edwardsbacteria bacterium]
MKKLIFALMAICLIAGMGFAFDDAYIQPLGHFNKAITPQNLKAPLAPDTIYHFNIYLLGSADRGINYNIWNKITPFNKYTRDGLGAMGDGGMTNVLVLGGSPHVAFNGWDDVAGTWKMWFWSAGTGMKAVATSSTFMGWPSIGYSPALNTLYICWSDHYFGYYGWENAMEGDIFISSSADGGNTWSNPVNISDFIQAVTPADSAQEYPKIAPRVGNAIHLMYLDDSESPGSAVQDIGPYTNAPIRYCQVNPNLSGLLYGPVPGGVTAYDWATTGNTEGIVTDAAENAIWVWTKMNTAQTTRLIGWNCYTGAAPDTIGFTLGSGWIGSPGITIDAAGWPIVCWHHAGKNASVSCADKGGIGGGLWQTDLDTFAIPSVSLFFPSITVSSTGDTLMMSAYAWGPAQPAFGMEPDLGLDYPYTTLPSWPNISGGLYVGIGADPTSQMVWGYFGADTAITRYPPTNLTHTVLDSANRIYQLNWLASADAEVDSYFVYRIGDTTTIWYSQYPFLNTNWTRVGGTATPTLTYTDDAPNAVDTVYRYLVMAIVKTPYYEYESGPTNEVIVPPPPGVEELPKPVAKLPKSFFLGQNAPNPFSAQTVIRYLVPAVSSERLAVSMKIYNNAGELVKTLVNEPKSPGAYKVTWDGEDDNGKRVADGVYFYRFKAGDFTDTKKMILVK